MYPYIEEFALSLANLYGKRNESERVADYYRTSYKLKLKSKKGSVYMNIKMKRLISTALLVVAACLGSLHYSQVSFSQKCTFLSERLIMERLFISDKDIHLDRVEETVFEPTRNQR